MKSPRLTLAFPALFLGAVIAGCATGDHTPPPSEGSAIPPSSGGTIEEVIAEITADQAPSAAPHVELPSDASAAGEGSEEAKPSPAVVPSPAGEGSGEAEPSPAVVPSPAGEGSGEAEPSPAVVPSPAADGAEDATPRPSSLEEAAPAASPAPIPWRTPTYALVARDMDLRQILETFGAAQGISTILSPGVAGQISGTFEDVPCNDFLDRLAVLHNLSWYWDGATLFVYGPGETTTMLLDLRYMKAGEVRAMLAELGVEDPRFPLKTASNDELIMVSGPPRYVTLVAEMISKADALREKRTFTEVETRLFPLENTWADDVSFSASSPESGGTIKGIASMLRDIVGKIAVPDARSAGDTNAPAVFQPLITAENRLNAVVVTDVAPRMPLYERLIHELDVPQQLVEIAVTVVELSRNDALDWQLSLGVHFNRDHTSVGAGQNAGNLFGTDAIEGRGLAGALTHLASNYDISASLTALRDSGKARSISRTALLTVNNLAVELTDTQSYHARIVGTEVASLETVSAGTTLQVKPRIMRNGADDLPARLWLTIALDDGGFESVSVDSMPMTRSSTLNTQTSIYEGETLMLAGYFRDIDQNARWGIPWLRDIPVIGWLFGGYTTQTETVQRLFLITPVIVDIDAEDLARIQATRLRDISEMEDLQEDTEDDAEEREIRDLEREERRERRRQDLETRLDARRKRIKAIRKGKDPDAPTPTP